VAAEDEAMTRELARNTRADTARKRPER